MLEKETRQQTKQKKKSETWRWIFTTWPSFHVSILNIYKASPACVAHNAG